MTIRRTNAGDLTVFSSDDADVDAFYEEFYVDPIVEEVHESSTKSDLVDQINLTGLIGLPSNIDRVIERALAQKRHLILYGPPGTGKTTIATKIAASLGSQSVVITATSDWTSQEIVGGYMPDGSGGIRFAPGLLLRNFDKITIVDEFNRADIDRAFGPMFTLLSGHSVELPFLFDPTDPDSEHIEILPPGEEEKRDGQYAPGNDWRLICTLNTYDKASLYQMSYALARRFAWIYVPVPSDLTEFIYGFALNNGWSASAPPQAGGTALLSRVWTAINVVTEIGPASIIDVMEYVMSANPGWDVTAASGDATLNDTLAAALDVYVVPQLEGIGKEQAEQLADELATMLDMDEPTANQLKHKLDESAI